MNRDRAASSLFRPATLLLPLLLTTAVSLAARGDPTRQAGVGSSEPAPTHAALDSTTDVLVLAPNQRAMVAECFASIGSANLRVQGAEAGQVEVLIVSAAGDTVGRHVNSQAEFRVAWLVLPGDCYRVLVSNQGTRPIEIRAGGDALPIRRRIPLGDTTSIHPA